MPGRLTEDQVEAYLDSRPGWAILSTIDKDGFPHSVPLGYFRLGRDIVMGVRDRTHKVANIERNPNVSIVL
jgi:nitroimidazol reductase NimA-like FMN-containing flavoprotein (pyridoxamine 5'-phosphate oxidase superfamily)